MTVSQRTYFRTFSSFGTVLALAMTSSAFANDGDETKAEGGFYISLLGGVTSPTDNSFDGVQDPVAPSPGTAGAPASVEVQFEDEFYGAAAIGYRIPTKVLGVFQPSVEIEFSRTTPDVSGGTFNGGNQTFGGQFEVNTYSVNYQSEIRWSKDQTIVPFLGGGIGVADVQTYASYFPNNGIATAPTFAVTDSDSALSLHSNIGLTFEINEKFDLNTRVRYQRVSGLNFDRRFIAGGNDAFNARLNGDYETTSFLAGVRYRF